jgi:hypothetical protein
MFRRILNSLLSNGVWFAAMMIHLMSATITSLAYLIIGLMIKWFEKHT